MSLSLIPAISFQGSLGYVWRTLSGIPFSLADNFKFSNHCAYSSVVRFKRIQVYAGGEFFDSFDSAKDVFQV